MNVCNILHSHRISCFDVTCLRLSSYILYVFLCVYILSVHACICIDTPLSWGRFDGLMSEVVVVKVVGEVVADLKLFLSPVPR